MSKKHKDKKAKNAETASHYKTSWRLSQYVAVLDRYLGLAEFILPLMGSKKREDRKMELWHLETAHCVRFLCKETLHEIQSFEDEFDDEEYTVIIDVDKWVNEASSECDHCFKKIPQDVLDIAAHHNALIYLHGGLWHQNLDSIAEWRRLSPIAIHDYLSATCPDLNSDNDALDAA